MDTQLLIADDVYEGFFLFMTYICHFIFTFMAYSPPYFSVNGMMILVLAYKNGFKSKSVYYGL